MAIDFPDSPTEGNTYISGNKKWEYLGNQKWAAKNFAAGGPWRDISSTFTAVNNDRIAANTSAAPFTINLPASPAFGTNVTFIDARGTWATNNLTIARNGSTIEGLAENFIVNATGDMVMTMFYNGSTWRVYV